MLRNDFGKILLLIFCGTPVIGAAILKKSIPYIASTPFFLSRLTKPNVILPRRQCFSRMPHAMQQPPGVPLNKPLGIINFEGTCYISAALQLLRAAHAAKPSAFARILSACDQGLVGAYKKSFEEFFIKPDIACEGIVHPLSFMKEWRRKNLKTYSTWMLKRRRCDDGSVSVEELYPEFAEKIYGGSTYEVVSQFINECSQVERTLKLENSFFLECGQFEFEHEGNRPIMLNDIFVSKCSADFIVLNNYCGAQFVPDFTIQRFGRADRGYQLTGIIQRVQGAREIGGIFFVGGHVKCYVKYQKQWFMCDDDSVVAMPEERVQFDLDEDARTTYDGRARQFGKLVSPHPYLLLYVRA